MTLENSVWFGVSTKFLMNFHDELESANQDASFIADELARRSNAGDDEALTWILEG